MKRTLLFLAVSFVIGATAQANSLSQELTTPLELGSTRTVMHPVILVERGVEFLIYPDGSLDFSVTPSSTRLKGQYVREVYNPLNHRVNYGTGANYRKGYVRYNHNGQVTQIGNLTVGYLRDGRVAQIGDIPVTYKKGRLDRIGTAKMHYDRSGRIYKQTDKHSKKYKNRGINILEVYGDRSRRS